MLNIIDNPNKVLKDVYGYDAFRGNQYEIINAALNGKDVMAVMTTGGGKSICFQVPALCVEGTTLVVSPIISLMKDQVDRLRSMGVKAGYLTNDMGPDETHDELSNLSNNKYKLFYISPERLQSKDFKQRLAQVNLSYLAVDEAHCVSVWGHDFRPAFKKVSPIIQEIEEQIGRRLPKLAFTATATEDVMLDITTQLKMQDSFNYIGGFDRENIEINIRHSVNKNADLSALLAQKKGQSAIIYCATVKAVNALYRDIKGQGYKVNRYNGQMAPEDKITSQDQFINNEVDIMVATNAFGMGIDKSDIRVVIHYQMPQNIENFFQEAGRAGRDGGDSQSFLFYHSKDANLQQFFIDSSFPDEALIKDVKNLIFAICADGPASITVDEIALAATSRMNKHEVNSCLRILDDQGIITMENIDNDYDNLNLDILDSTKEVDFEYLSGRHKKSMGKLHDMSAFCETKLCRRRYILRYFGEQQKHKNCGNCDTCNTQKLNKAKFSQVIPEETIKSVLSTLKVRGDSVKKKELSEILMGVNSFKIKRNKLNELDTFGSLKHMTMGDIDNLYKEMEKEFLVKVSLTSDAEISIKEKGNDFLSGIGNVIIDANSKFESSDNATIESNSKSKYTIATKAVFNHVLYEKLEAARKVFAKEVEKPISMICSDKCLKLMATIKPENKVELRDCGLRDGAMRLFGDKFIKTVDLYNRSTMESDSEIEMF